MNKKLTKKQQLAMDCAILRCKLYAVYMQNLDYYNDENVRTWFNRYLKNPLFVNSHMGQHITIKDLENIKNLLIADYNNLNDEEKLIYEII